MLTKDFNDKKIPMLGLGAMRLPLIEGTSEVDTAEAQKMVAYALLHGVNYFDTAYSYHSGKSEVIMGDILKDYPRDSYYLATKYPGHQIIDNFEIYKPREIFEEQLERLKTDYIDFYLLHNVCEASMDVYTNEKYGVIEYFLEEKRKERIKHLGFSTHARPDALEAFLDRYGEHMEFCQIQLNYLDWTLQSADEKYEMLKKRGIPVFVMEPIRGGKLVNLPESAKTRLGELSQERTTPEWAFKWLMRLDNVKLVLSGMSNMKQLKENVETFSTYSPLTDNESEVLLDIAEGLKASVPCTGCGYCTRECPVGLDIPMLLSTYNQLKVSSSVNISMLLEFAPENKRPTACIGCGKCKKLCPQGIDIPKVLKELSVMLEKQPKWADVCRERANEKK